MSINEIEAKARDLRQLQTLIEEAQAEADAIRDAIKAYMGDSEELRAGEYKIHLVARHKRQDRHHGPETGHAGRSPGVHPRDHHPPLLRGMRKAPRITADESRCKEATTHPTGGTVILPRPPQNYKEFLSMQSISMQLREACRLRAYMPHPREFLEGMADIFSCRPLDASKNDFFHFLETIYNAGRIHSIREEREKRRRRQAAKGALL